MLLFDLNILSICCSQNLFSSVQSLSRVRPFVTPWIAARQASLSITNSQSLLKLMSIELVMPSSHLMLQNLLAHYIKALISKHCCLFYKVRMHYITWNFNNWDIRCIINDVASNCSVWYIKISQLTILIHC